MYNYNPSDIMNPQLQLNNYLNDQQKQAAASGFSQAMGKPNAASVALGAVAGALTTKLLFDIFDR